ncbi:hypothetical protein D9M68_904240 [compost metagenome]
MRSPRASSVRFSMRSRGWILSSLKAIRRSLISVSLNSPGLPSISRLKVSWVFWTVASICSRPLTS